MLLHTLGGVAYDGKTIGSELCDMQMSKQSQFFGFSFIACKRKLFGRENRLLEGIRQDLTGNSVLRFVWWRRNEFLIFATVQLLWLNFAVRVDISASFKVPGID